jgi:hypothetical protein
MRIRASLSRAVFASLPILGAAACEAPGLAEGSVVVGLDPDGRLVVGQLTCDSDRMPAREVAIIWRVTGDRDDPLEKLWEGRLRESAASLPSSNVDLFKTYEFVDGPLGDVDTIAGLSDQLDLSVVLQFSGAAGLPLLQARSEPGAYFYHGDSGSFAQLQTAFCAA